MTKAEKSGQTDRRGQIWELSYKEISVLYLVVENNLSEIHKLLSLEDAQLTYVREACLKNGKEGLAKWKIVL